MTAVRRRLSDAATYRGLLYLLSGMPLGLAWFVALVTVWSLCLGLIVTPAVIPLVIALAAMTHGFATVEAELARALLGVDARAPAWMRSDGGLWARLRSIFAGGFWRAQAYLLLRWFAGFPLAVVMLSLLAAAVAMIFAPVWVPFVHGGAHLGLWRPHTFLQSLALVPVGLLLLALTLLAVGPLAAACGAVVTALLPGHRQTPDMRNGGTSLRDPARAPRTPAIRPRRALAIHATVDAAVLFVLVLIWALTSLGYFWPVWVALPVALAFAIHWWVVLIGERPALVERFRGNTTLAASVGVGCAVALYLIAVWAITGHGYFWPVWPMLGIAAVIGVQTAAVLLADPDRTELTERIETLETTRAGAVDVQDSELRRIERDLHDGAQARLVALGMSLGMAEQKLAQDPGRAGELLAEARVGAEQALRELRDLARGIHPPVLADRGLEAAVRSLASAAPMPVELSVELPERPPPAVESAAYFVVAEALANAAKHAHAQRMAIRAVCDGGTLELEIRDDGIGGADANGSGLQGLRRRVEALDGTLAVSSPLGGPTTIHAELPCRS